MREVFNINGGSREVEVYCNRVMNCDRVLTPSFVYTF